MISVYLLLDYYYTSHFLKLISFNRKKTTEYFVVYQIMSIFAA